MTDPKPKLALYWAASCGGCEIAVLAIDAKILDVAAAFDIVLWPCVMDGKVRDVERLDDGAIAVCLFNGAIRTSEQEYMARLLRAKSRVLVAFGACAAEGGIPGLANLTSREAIFATCYLDAPTVDNPDGVVPMPAAQVPEGTLHLPTFYDTVRTLDQVVTVDYTLPGCPPEADRIAEALDAIVAGRLPPLGAVLGAGSTVCDECTRTRSEKRIGAFRRTWQVIPDEDTCLLEQGLPCWGIATRAGCGARCPQVNAPCLGCYGPSAGVEDQGARLLSALASVLDVRDEPAIDAAFDAGIPDPAGTFYRFGLAHGLLRRARVGGGAR